MSQSSNHCLTNVSLSQPKNKTQQGKQTVMFDKFHFGDKKKGVVHSYKELAALEQRIRAGVAHVVISDPPYGMKAGGHTPFNCDMEKSKSMVLEDRRYGVSISMKENEVAELYSLAFEHATKLLVIGGFFLVKITIF